MASRLTKAEADAAARAVEAVLAGGTEDADCRRENEDPGRLHDLLTSVARKLWERT